MKKVELLFSEIIQAPGQQFVLILAEKNGSRRLPIVIGFNEAQAILMEVNNIPRSRPLTHDLFVNTLSAFGIIITEVVITKLEDSIFFSELICEQSITKTELNIDSRTSDAIALALRFKANIYASEDVMDKASFSLDFLENPEQKLDPKEKITKRIEDLKKQLSEAIKNEDYEKAAQIKKEIENLQKKL